MAGALSKTEVTRVVTLRTLLSAAGVESSGLHSHHDAVQHADRYNRILEKLQAETAKTSAGVLITVQDRDASLLQSRIAEGGDAGSPLQAGGLEAQFGDGVTGGDVWGWIRSMFDHIDQTQWHPIVRPPDNNIGTLADTGRVAVLGDWGTNLYGAPVSAASIKRTGGYELLLHLGDIYYSGTKTEAQQRFLEAWPTSAGKVSRALNGNHEMYSGGFAYFEDILPKFKQQSSYFALQNKHWLLVGLDTAHTDHALDHQQVAWVKSVVQKGGPRKVILFSHHQPFSRLDKQGPELQAALADLFQKKVITAWYWGHEHDCIIYDKHPRFGLLGRCIGHGGIPAPRKTGVLDAAADRRLNGVAWKRLSASADAPSSLALDGPNPLVKGEEEKFGPHGYLTLDFDGPNLIERVHLPDGTEVFKGPL
ncbi:metallophosphoesterase [Bradyrhizobium sp. CW1]|uniref:metallophosphoesterase family protein n=1 Tax=Bradyrhizobium sp. CW1 TaxID=2782686 RepID=UPI001FFE8D50|nr:metallophosphoesterase [Bradyrhizobium sp. CW1]UPJ27804.1 metallophosphoesterase [Bradyrhizobium sp. CW1]